MGGRRTRGMSSQSCLPCSPFLDQVAATTATHYLVDMRVLPLSDDLSRSVSGGDDCTCNTNQHTACPHARSIIIFPTVPSLLIFLSFV